MIQSMMKKRWWFIIIIRRHLSWSLFIFLFFMRLWHIRISGQYLKCGLKEALISSCRERFLLVHKFFVLVFLQISVTCFSNFSLFSNMTPSNFSHSLFFISYSLTLKLTASLKLNNKWHLSALFFNNLFSNYSNKAFDAFSKDAITPLMSSGSIIICIARNISIVWDEKQISQEDVKQ